MKRPLTLAASIVAVSLLAFEILFEVSILYTIIVFQNADSLTVEPIFYVIYVLCIAVLLVTQILNILLITLWRSSPEKFSKNKGVYISALVFDLFIPILAIIRLYLAGLNIDTTMILWYMMLFFAMFACFALCCVDFIKEKKKVSAYESIAETEKERAIIANHAVENFKTNIAKLDAMKEQNLITAEEYQTAKQNYIADELKK